MYLGYESTVKPGEIHGLVLLDRSADMVTPFCVQQTYEGMIDEHFGIKGASIDIDKKIIKPDEEEKDNKVENIFLRNEDDMFFRQLRNLNFASLEPFFSSEIHKIEELMRKKDDAQTIDELQDYVKRLKKANITSAKDDL